MVLVRAGFGHARILHPGADEPAIVEGAAGSGVGWPAAGSGHRTGGRDRSAGGGTGWGTLDRSTGTAGSRQRCGASTGDLVEVMPSPSRARSSTRSAPLDPGRDSVAGPGPPMARTVSRSGRARPHADVLSEPEGLQLVDAATAGRWGGGAAGGTGPG
ncbi:hypothetical protein C1701_00040 [Actinoalloteichus sp. AHMU CJ021]|nr:hypothetical protein C1701_00040 [Actinoalloteichus sp. AHMU CJ021]